MNPLLKELSTRAKALVMSLMLAFVAAVGYLDYGTGNEISVHVFYLVPVVICIWSVGPAAGGIVLVLCSAVAAALDYITEKYQALPVLVWNNIVVSVFYILTAYFLYRLKIAYAREQELSRTDDLTKLSNPRHFYELLHDEVDRAARYGHPLTIMYVDCDNFKQVNDTLGHDAGDRLLGTIAETIRRAIRRSDVGARVGGDEFCILMPETGPGNPEQMAEKLRDSLMRVMEFNGWPVTFSIGVAVYAHVINDIMEMIGTADELMYEAKRDGKNRIKVRILGQDAR